MDENIIISSISQRKSEGRNIDTKTKPECQYKPEIFRELSINVIRAF